MTRAEFSTAAEFAALVSEFSGPDQAAIKAAIARDAVLTKPPGALGRLEEIARWYCGWRGDATARVTHPQTVIFAGNHGVTAQGVSAFPAEVTVQMVANFEAGGAAINQICTAVGSRLDVYPIDLERPTADFTTAPAMTEAELVAALAIGWNAVRSDTDLLTIGEMGIGNTTAGAAIFAALFGGDGASWVGRGTGVDNDGLKRKATVVDLGLARHGDRAPLAVLQALGGREIAAMAGAIAGARSRGIPVLIDGFIASSAAAVLHALAPSALDHCLAAHVSAEQGHVDALAKMGLDPLLSLGLRLGEGSGAAAAIPLIRTALACHSGMATFAEAGVSDG